VPGQSQGDYVMARFKPWEYGLPQPPRASAAM
jgi:hypothetical protein